MRAQQKLLQRVCHNELVVRCLAAAAVRVGPARTDPAGRPMSGPSIPVVEPKKYDEQLSAKRQRVADMFSDFSLPELQVFESARSHYRMRSEFRVWHDGEEMYPIMFRQGEDGKPERVRMDQYPVASSLINQHMVLLMAHLRARPVLRDKLYQVNFHTAVSGDAMVTLIYHKKLDSEWQKAAEGLRKHLATAPDSGLSLPSVIGRSRKQKVVLGQDFVIERLHVDGRDLCYKQMEGAFSQPNAGVARQMLSWAAAATRGGGAADMLELYCGNGNFTIALAGNFRRVLATEISKSAIAAAQFNLEANDVGNVLVGRMSAEEFTAAWKANRSMKRLEGLDWDSLQLRTLLVDPPRAGLDSATEQLLLEFDQVVYVSCNPETLHKNLQAVKSTHRIAQFALFDQFPYSDHMECGVLLQRIADSTE